MVGDGNLSAGGDWRAVVYICLVGRRLIQVKGAESDRGYRVRPSQHSVLCGAGHSALLLGQLARPEDHVLTAGHYSLVFG
jgi:hypothetical protein